MLRKWESQTSFIVILFSSKNQNQSHTKRLEIWRWIKEYFVSAIFWSEPSRKFTRHYLVIVSCVNGRNLPIDTEMYIQCKWFDIYVIYHREFSFSKIETFMEFCWILILPIFLMLKTNSYTKDKPKYVNVGINWRPINISIKLKSVHFIRIECT